MHKKIPSQHLSPGRITILSLSLAAALATMASTTALAGPTVTGSATVTGNTSSVTWNGSGTFLINNGVVLSGTPALTVSVTSGTLTNNGTTTGILNSGNIGLLNNSSSGTISGGTGISNSGTIGTLTNTGTITGTTNAISNSGTLGPIANNGGTIAGNITNTAGQNLTITGGAGATFGTLTGSGSGIGAGNIGLITNTASNLVFSAGNQLLNDNINVTGRTAINSGSVLQINNTITVTGNYTQNAAATLNIGVANGAVAGGVVSTDSGYGRLIVSGVATFDAGTSIALKKLSTYSFAQGQRFVVVQANNGNAQYNASLLNYSADGYSGAISGASVTDSDNNAKTDLLITLGSSSSGSTSPNISATTPDAVSALSGLFRYGGTNANMLNMFNAAAALGSTADANRAGAQLSPAANTASTIQSAQVSTQAVLNVTSSHIDTLRTAQAAGSGVSTGERASDIALWGQAFGGQANQGNRAAGSGYRAGYSGLLIGADTALSDQWRIGGVFSYADTSVNGGGDNTGSSAHIKAYGLTGYGGYTAENWYLNLSGGIVQQKYNTLRSVAYTGFSGNAAGQFDGTQYVASAQAGYPIRLDAMTTLTPIAGLTYSRLRQDAYTETGSVAALHVNSSSTSSVKSDLGAKLERSFKTSYGEVTPSVQLSWRHEYRDTSVQSVANFAADASGATSFTTQGAAANKNTGVLVLGATLARSRNLTLAARYTMEAARGYTAQTADVRLRYQF
ncbi:outer membrane autotransporter barrel domain-containing protein [Herbaspirillum sp. CF444]|uniref:autotransporter family protein n=1 Tax=Herbaspirillum sp. CF444 TaxID=1144319 RepID=UPI0002723420|nr:autotransporter domain-containing protein [Herbaspirillum sp. CF444]EJL83657.1 outer membrane autotransporter barrel domain-containing protein [Herbaspirillum sp. CF444]